ncbi:MAG: hypothetical protein XU09_C0008G0087 [Thaumarchaeota archaeon CSP1-1]|nr:MAG: hypothetical protein XU09_C0008G0087 [Thaumarchaeota archaeon CSP1-1]
MTIITKPGVIIKIQLLQGSQAKNYFESKERLFLGTILIKLQKDTSNELNLTVQEKDMIEHIFKKYKKYL